VGYGDNLMASGMARGARARGRRIAFGEQGERKIRWDHNSEPVFRHNPNIAPLGSEGAGDLEWVRYYKGHRLYNAAEPAKRVWRWRESFRVQPGQMYLTPEETAWAAQFGDGFVIVEPNVPNWKMMAANKQWPESRWREVSLQLHGAGRQLVQLSYGERIVLPHARQVISPSFRHAVALLHRAAYAILPEGGLHHAAAAETRSLPGAEAPDGALLRAFVPAVVIFGGFIPPSVTGYPFHINLAAGQPACGSWGTCQHCKTAMEAISVEDVLNAARRITDGRN
jgi:hypothetical protein